MLAQICVCGVACVVEMVPVRKLSSIDDILETFSDSTSSWLYRDTSGISRFLLPHILLWLEHKSHKPVGGWSGY